MMLDGKKDKLISANQIEDQVVVHDAFPYVVALAEEWTKTLSERFGFG